MDVNAVAWHGGWPVGLTPRPKARPRIMTENRLHLEEGLRGPYMRPHQEEEKLLKGRPPCLIPMSVPDTHTPDHSP